MTITDDPMYLEVSEALNGFQKRIIEKIEKEQQRLKACKIKSEIETKMAQELKLNTELKTRLAELSKRKDDLERICSNFASGVTISDSDKNRLDNVKEMYEIGKKLTGIRFDYSAPPNLVKGYIKSEQNKTLTPFELEAGAGTSEQLWSLIETAVGASAMDKENCIANK